MSLSNDNEEKELLEFINQADSVDALKLIGLSTRQAISLLKFKAERGKLSSLDELLEIHGIGERTLAKIKIKGPPAEWKHLAFGRPKRASKEKKFETAKPISVQGTDGNIKFGNVIGICGVLLILFFTLLAIANNGLPWFIASATVGSIIGLLAFLLFMAALFDKKFPDRGAVLGYATAIILGIVSALIIAPRQFPSNTGVTKRNVPITINEIPKSTKQAAATSLMIKCPISLELKLTPNPETSFLTLKSQKQRNNVKIILWTPTYFADVDRYGWSRCSYHINFLKAKVAYNVTLNKFYCSDGWFYVGLYPPLKFECFEGEKRIVSWTLAKWDAKSPPPNLLLGTYIYPNTSPEVKIVTRLPEFLRKSIFQEIMEADELAKEKAESKYSMASNMSPTEKFLILMKRLNEYSKLKQRYEKEIAQKYGLSEEELNEIKKEGLIKNWTS